MQKDVCCFAMGGYVGWCTLYNVIIATIWGDCRETFISILILTLEDAKTYYMDVCLQFESRVCYILLK